MEIFPPWTTSVQSLLSNKYYSNGLLSIKRLLNELAYWVSPQVLPSHANVGAIVIRVRFHLLCHLVCRMSFKDSPVALVSLPLFQEWSIVQLFMACMNCMGTCWMDGHWIYIIWMAYILVTWHILAGHVHFSFTVQHGRAYYIEIASFAQYNLWSSHIQLLRIDHQVSA